MLLAALCGMVNQHQQQIIEFQNAQIDTLLKQLGKKLLLSNAGVSAETRQVVMRYKDFGTTEKHYGAPPIGLECWPGTCGQIGSLCTKTAH